MLEKFKKLPLRKGVGVILLNSNNKVFVAKRIDNPKNFWQMPQGGVDNNEDFLSAALRELKEETQLTLPQETKFLYKTPRPEIKGGDYMYVFHYLSDHELTPTLDHEHTDFGYYQKDELPEDIYYLGKFLK